MNHSTARLSRLAAAVLTAVVALAPTLASAAPRIPNDSYWDELWHLQYVGAPDAWGRSLGMETVPIAIIDSGVDLDHPDLKDNIWRNMGEVAGDGIDNDGNGFVDDVFGWDFVSGDNDPSPDLSDGYTLLGVNHGTVSAGLASAKGDNGTGVVGMTWQAPIMALRALDSMGAGDPNNVSRAVDYAVDNGAKVINLSFVGTSHSPSLSAALRRAYDRGVFVVAAAGNAPEGQEAINLDQDPRYPVCFDRDSSENFVYGVAATDRYDRKAEFSNFGASCVDISAPGDRIVSTQYYDPTHPDFGAPYGGYYSGTSAAAPLVSGLVALIRSLDSNLTPKQVMNILTENSFDINPQNPEYFGRLGRGRIEAGRSVESVIKSPRKEQTQPIVTSESLQPPGYDGGLVVAAAGPGRNPELRLFTEDGLFVRSFNAYPTGFRGGVSLAVGNFDGHNRTSIVTGALAGGGPHVRIFDINTRPIGGFFAYDSAFTGGVEVAAGDVDGDGIDEIVTGAGPGGGPHVRIFDRSGRPLGGFFAYDESYRGGIDVAAGDLTGDGEAEIVVGRTDGSGQLRVFDPHGQEIMTLDAFGPEVSGALSVDVEDLTGDGTAEIVVRLRMDGGEAKSAIFSGSGEYLTGDHGTVPVVEIVAVGHEGYLPSYAWGSLAGGSPEVTVLRRNPSSMSFWAFEPAFTGGVRAIKIDPKR